MEDRSNQIKNVLKQRPKPLVQWGNFSVLLSIITAIYFSNYIRLPIYQTYCGKVSNISNDNNHKRFELSIKDNFGIKEGTSGKVYGFLEDYNRQKFVVHVLHVRKNSIQLYSEEPTQIMVNNKSQLVKNEICVELIVSYITLFDCFFKK